MKFSLSKFYDIVKISVIKKAIVKVIASIEARNGLTDKVGLWKS